MKRVTGLGGVFIKCKDRAAMMDWYKNRLGIDLEEWGATFSPSKFQETHPGGYQVLSLNAHDTKYFAPSTASFMLNFTVSNLDELLPVLKEEGVNVIDKSEESEYGKFAWLLDPDGNKVELWQPPLHLPE